MKKIYRLFLVALSSVALFSCSNQLEVTNPSVVDGDFVFKSYETAKTAMIAAYNTYVGNVNSGFPTNFEDIGSDVERCSAMISAAPLVGAAQLYGGSPSYAPENFQINTYKHLDSFYKSISICNQIIYQIERMEGWNNNMPNDWSDLLGQAYAFRATVYYDIVRLFGDCIYIDEAGKEVTDMTSRDFILESEIACLEKVEPYLYKLGENSHYPDQITRNYVDGLIGRMCFAAAGYATRRTDVEADFYKGLDGKAISFEVWGTDPARNAVYERRTDWKKFYEKALPYLKKAVNDPGEAELTTVDPRSDKEGRTFGNPFQYYFEQINDQIMATESIFEATMKQEGGGSRIAYNFGRGSNGGSPAYPPKSNAQTNSYPQVLYGLFDPQDMRRDVSVNVTGNTGTGLEAIYTWLFNNKNNIGIGCNKYDLNRQENPDARQLYSGINYIMMRQADVILMLAEAYAQTGDKGSAENELKKVHNRAFAPAIRDAKYAELLKSCNNDVLEAIYKERALEFVGENIRRYDLVRTGKLPQIAVELRAQMIKDLNDVRTKGYATFENGNQWPAYIWTKLIDAKDMLGYRLTAQTPESVLSGDKYSDEYGLLVPGWRGQHDDWLKVATEDGAAEKLAAGYATDKVATNLSIIGLFEYIDPASDLAKSLEARGYAKTPWGASALGKKTADPAEAENAGIAAEWSTNFMCGYTDADYAAKKAPIHLMPYQQTFCVTTGLKNGYGFKSE